MIAIIDRRRSVDNRVHRQSKTIPRIVTDYKPVLSLLNGPHLVVNDVEVDEFATEPAS